MITPSIDELLEKVDDRYYLITLVSIRARQILEAEQYNDEKEMDKAVSIATDEIFEGRVRRVK